MGTESQLRALRNYRKRLTKSGMARFEVLGLSKDRDLIRRVARLLAEESPEAAEIRTAIHTRVEGKSETIGGVVAALRRSPMVGTDLVPARPRVHGRKVGL